MVSSLYAYGEQNCVDSYFLKTTYCCESFHEHLLRPFPGKDFHVITSENLKLEELEEEKHPCFCVSLLCINSEEKDRKSIFLFFVFSIHLCCCMNI